MGEQLITQAESQQRRQSGLSTSQIWGCQDISSRASRPTFCHDGFTCAQGTPEARRWHEMKLGKLSHNTQSCCRMVSWEENVRDNWGLPERRRPDKSFNCCLPCRPVLQREQQLGATSQPLGRAVRPMSMTRPGSSLRILTLYNPTVRPASPLARDDAAINHDEAQRDQAESVGRYVPYSYCTCVRIQSKLRSHRNWRWRQQFHEGSVSRQ